jgi:lipase
MRLHVHEWGEADAPALVCLHGVTGHGARFRKLAEERLADRFHVIAPDLRGHGRSGWEPPWRCEVYADDVLETLDDLGIEAAIIAGHSFGGRVLLELAARAPERLERAILLDPAIHVLPHVAFDHAEDQRRERIYTSLAEAVGERVSQAPTNPRELVEADLTEHLEPTSDGRFRLRYSQACVVYLYADVTVAPPPPETLRVPTLLLYAPAFGLVREDLLEVYREALGELLTVVPVPGGHMVMWDEFDLTADSIDAFLAERATTAAG